MASSWSHFSLPFFSIVYDVILAEVSNPHLSASFSALDKVRLLHGVATRQQEIIM